MNTASPPPAHPLRVVIVGAGFGGLEAARALARAPVELTIVDRQNHHLFQPLLYQVATAALSPGDIAWPVRSVFRRQANVTTLMAEVTGIDPAARVVRADGASIPYDALVLATGATHSYFGRDDWAPFAPGIKTIEDATEIRRRLLTAFERAEMAADEAERQRLLTFVVVGGGPTGVELAGAMAELARQALKSEFRRADPRRARIILVEAGPRLLASFPEDLSAYAARSLARMGVEIRTGARVTGCDAGGVVLDGAERIAASSTVWAAGVVASPAGAWIGAERDGAGRVAAGPDLTVPGHPEIFVVGDLVTARDGTGRPIPGNAPAAKQMGGYVGKVIAARARGELAPPPFAYRHHGDLATIGRRSAVVAMDGFRLKGWLGWWFWGLAHVYYLIGFRSRVVVSFEWFWSYLTFQRGARLITRRLSPAAAAPPEAVPEPGAAPKPPAASRPAELAAPGR
ncbi:NAD(P)/FAD-dependent oxidoreductase [Roseomonas nepalensis]|uniref:NAD(P)/FAD-dependent oxidoreductase n=1 Tax=Muricoccus nepalensis TaxID=1854500 RepID=A0A502GEZ2_9PROT|nr:NAD(P)/FAD-dependent oxidoreductase [Roseomonas nepalensis]TPG60454.1 NAD(P)/FAD-dependent oxidoreductase [Roseomonas nepalensis]